MALSDLMPAGGIVADVTATSRKQALHAIAELAQRSLNVSARPVLDAVLEREKLGSTGVGDGVAIPHARTDLVNQVCGVFMRLSQPVEFDAVDGRPADLIFLLLAPESAGAEHLKALAQIARLFRRAEIREAVRAAPDAEAIARLLANGVKSDAA
jgi:PTS system nitrogen regulatory IIA component